MSKIWILIALLLLSFVVAPSWAKTCYVSNSTANGGKVGSDSNNGTSWSTPWLTIAHAATACSSGDTIEINTGRYAESSGSGYLYFDRTFTSPTTFQTYTGSADVTVTGSSSSDNVIFCNGSYLTLKNINFIDRTNTNLDIFRFAGSFSNLYITGGTWTILLNNDSMYRSGMNANPTSDGVTLAFITISGVTVTTTGTQGKSYTTALAFGTTGNMWGGTTLSGNACRSVTLTSDKISGVGIGVSLQGATGVDVAGCTLSAGPYGSWPTSSSTYGALVGEDGDGATATTTAAFSNDYIDAAIPLDGVYTSHGILFGSGSKDCSITYSNILSGDQGIVLKDCSTNVAEWNSIYNTDSGAIVGLYFKGATHCVGENNTIVSTFGIGIKDSNDPSGDLSSFNTIQNNTSEASGTNVICYYFGTPSEDSGGTIVNNNAYELKSGATCAVNGKWGLTTISSLRSAYGPYLPSGNDSSSALETMPPGSPK